MEADALPIVLYEVSFQLHTSCQQLCPFNHIHMSAKERLRKKTESDLSAWLHPSFSKPKDLDSGFQPCIDPFLILRDLLITEQDRVFWFHIIAPMQS